MPKCRYCGDEIIFIENEKRRRIPVDPDIVVFKRIYSKSELYQDYILPTGEKVAGRPLKRFEIDRTFGYVPHKYTCTGRDIKYSKQKRRNTQR